MQLFPHRTQWVILHDGDRVRKHPSKHQNEICPALNRSPLTGSTKLPIAGRVGPVSRTRHSSAVPRQLIHLLRISWCLDGLHILDRKSVQIIDYLPSS